MARLFNGTDDGLVGAGPKHTTYPFVAGVWGYFPTSVPAGIDTAIGFGDESGTGRFELQHNGTIARGRIRTPNAIIQSGGVISADVWFHLMWVSRSATDHELYFNNSSVGTEATSVIYPGSVDAIGIGVTNRTTDEAFWPGYLADAFFAGVNPTADQRAAVAAAISPRRVFSQGALDYWDLIRGINRPYFGSTLSERGTGTTVVAHPRMIYRPPRHTLSIPAAAVGDPEGPLVGGKLIRGGILTRGRLVA